MTMNHTVDARGQVCPLPLMMMTKTLKSGQYERFAILVDNETAHENVCRAAVDRGWRVDEDCAIKDGWRVVLARS